jgi:hypothetical protein
MNKENERPTLPPPMSDYPQAVIDPESRKPTVKIKRVWVDGMTNLSFKQPWTLFNKAEKK